MTDSSTQSITIAAPPAAIMAVIADFAAYPQWTDAIRAARIIDPGDGRYATQVEFSMDAGLIKDTYQLSYTWAPDGLSVSWDLVTGQIQKAQHGSYVLRPLDGGSATEVTYSLSVELTIPLIGVLRRKAERVIMDTALKELRTRVEAVE